MNDLEAIEMMRRASEEIKNLRREIDRLAPKADAYETISTILGLLPGRSVGMGEDLCWRLDKRIAELRAQVCEEDDVKARA